MYVSLVNSITRPDNWQLILDKFRDFGNNPKIKCLSLPVESLTHQDDRAEQVGHWWNTVEQPSIELSLDYEFLVQTDVVDCYADIYTHSIAWALHTKPVAKARRHDHSLIGNSIDSHIQDMKQGQTNGIPQGSALMDFIAEMVLGYADTELRAKIAQEINEYQILRYRDDYRIFVNNPRDGELVLKYLTEVMIDLGLRLNPEKTRLSREVIRSSIKDDKLTWMFRKQCDNTLQRHLLIIHDQSIKHPNSGSVVRALSEFQSRIIDATECESPLALISIVADIAYNNPKTYHISVAVLSKLVSFLESDDEKEATIERLRRRFSQLPNTGHMEIWLQRISFPIDPAVEFNEPLCQAVSQSDIEIWNNEWISSAELRQAITSTRIVNVNKLENSPAIVSNEEVALFRQEFWEY